MISSVTRSHLFLFFAIGWVLSPCTASAQFERVKRLTAYFGTNDLALDSAGSLWIAATDSLFVSPDIGGSVRGVVDGQFSFVAYRKQDHQTYAYELTNGFIAVSSSGAVSSVQTTLDTLGVRVRHALLDKEGAFYAISDSGIFYTSPDGRYWVKRDSRHTAKASVKRWFFTPQGEMLLLERTLNSDSIFTSSNGGVSWQRLATLKTFGTFLQLTDVARAPWGDYVVCAAGGGNERVTYRSTDNGVSWDTMNVPLDTRYISFALDSTMYAMSGNTYVNDLYLSRDRGQTWIYSGVTHGEDIVKNFWHLTPEISYVHIAGFDGLYRTRDAGRRWMGLQTEPQLVDDLYYIPERDLYVAGGWEGVFTSTDGGRRWQLEIQGLRGNYKTVHMMGSIEEMSLNPNTLECLACTDSGLFHGSRESSFDGYQWTRLPNFPYGPNCHNLLAVPNGNYLVGGLVSTDRGETWIATDSDVVYTALASGRVFSWNASSTDGGLTWSPLTEHKFDAIWQVAEDAEGYIYAATNKGLQRLKDGVWMHLFGSGSTNERTKVATRGNHIVASVTYYKSPMGDVWSLISSHDHGEHWDTNMTYKNLNYPDHVVIDKYDRVILVFDSKFYMLDEAPKSRVRASSEDERVDVKVVGERTIELSYSATAAAKLRIWSLAGAVVGEYDLPATGDARFSTAIRLSNASAGIYFAEVTEGAHRGTVTFSLR